MRSTTTTINLKSYKRLLFTTLAWAIGICAIWVIQDSAWAAKDLETIAEGVSDQVRAVAQLLVIVAYVAGVGFALAGIVQFKAHKDNPAQVPLSKPIVYLVVGACLLFLPSIMQSAGETIFGGEGESGGDFDVTQGL